jgi:cellulose 1,4-beta-cellobiosidase
LLVHLAAPASLTATPGNGQVSLSWPASVGATSYHVKRARVSGGPYTTVACATTTSYADIGLTGGTTYYYVVSAAYSAGLNGGGESANSSEASATPQGVAAPSAPAVLTATPGNGQVALSWSASSGATSYNVKRATVNGGPYTLIASPSATGYTNSGLTNGTTYYYVVSAVNSAGESGNSSQVSATPQPPSQPAAPTNVVATSGPPKGGVTLRWTQSATPGVTQNYIYRRTSTGSYTATPAVKISAATSYVDTKLTSGNSYCYQVTAVSSGGESPKTSEVCAKAK